MEKQKVRNWLKKKSDDIGLKGYKLEGKKSGESNHNFILSSGDKKYVLRVSKDVSRECRLENEAEKLDYLESQGINCVPSKEYFRADTEIGAVLLQSFVGEENLNSGKMTEPRLKSLARNIAGIHNLPVERYNRFSDSNINRRTSLKNIYRRDFRKWSKRPFKEYRELAEKIDPRIQRYFRKQRNLLEKVPDIQVRKGLVHGDLGFNIRGSGKDIFIVDWEFSRVDYPGNEILYCFEHENLSEQQRKIFLEAYQEHRDLGEAFEKTRQIYPGFLAFNDAVWAAKRIEIEPDKEKEHRERLEKKLDKLESFYSS